MPGHTEQRDRFVPVPVFPRFVHWITRLALAVLLLAPVTAPSSAGAADSSKLKDAMQTLKDETAKLGKPRLDGEILYFGGTKVNGDFTVVDLVKAKYGGTATLFARKGGNFVRVSTNVVKDGQRAVGTILDPSGPAVAAIKQGTAFYGLVDILGTIYDTGYEPIKSEAGETIGVYYVGYAME
jgi:hypothetical protein